MTSFASLYEKFDASQARKLAGFIQQAYDQFDLRGTGIWKLEGSYELVGQLGTEEVPFGFVVSETDSNNVVVVFRGTKRFIEWFKDVNIQLVSYRNSTEKNGPMVKATWDIADGVTQESSSEIPTTNDFGDVTAGFRGIYINLRQQMIRALDQCSADYRIFVTGHSLGAALATLAIPDILNNTKFNNHQKIELYTFASPRCGDRTFATAFQETGIQHWRIANTEDFVTTLPFPTGNVFRAESPMKAPEAELGQGGVNGVDENPNPIFGFFKEMYNRRKRRMPDYVHTGTPVYFTFHAAALEMHHNLHGVYMNGIGQDPLNLRK
ncbi:MAG: lipase family protein [Nostoc sp. DedQUE08]|uniref:lipase family protein n=1 Tax=unclassified Nostoc TaxID=2593658 RepID=UPI002AD40717|nr:MULTISPECIES: lipase family protein [unclassified Nostoc]MDZ8064365.1 lipase family protein [Nostoc sp. DedQUE08]MDZ8092373.1 lipase family protein [Nostoc sp. DedQUE05]